MSAMESSSKIFSQSSATANTRAAAGGRGAWRDWSDAMACCGCSVVSEMLSMVVVGVFGESECEGLRGRKKSVEGRTVPGLRAFACDRSHLECACPTDCPRILLSAKSS